MKTINIKVVPNAKKDAVTMEPRRLKVYVTAPARDGKANKKVREVLAEFFQVKRSQIEIIRGEKTSQKVIGIKSESLGSYL